MKAIIFDSGTLISLEMSGLLYLLEGLKENFDGEFIITREVYSEVIEKPLTIKRFELGAMRLKSLLDNGILSFPKKIEVKDSEISSKSKKILEIANSTFFTSKRPIKIISSGEASCLALSSILNDKNVKNVIAVDERTTRILGEKPDNLKKIFENKLHMKVNSKENNYKYFHGFKFIRSTEIAYVAYKKGLIDINNANLLDAVLYSLKFKGAAVSSEEIEEIKRIG